MAINFSMMGFADRLALRDDYQSLVPGERTPPPEVAMDEKLPKIMQINPIKFDPEGSDYDMKSAVAAGMKPEIDPEDGKPHWGSVIGTTKEEQEKYGLPEESYMLLKGKSHETWDKAVQGEAERGFRVKKFGDRYYSIPAEINEEGKDVEINNNDKFYSLVKTLENSVKAGFDKKTNTWKPHKSLEGGRSTVAWGHKLTPEEAKGNYVMIGDTKVSLDTGLTNEQADALFKQDMDIAKTEAKKFIGEGFDGLSNKQQLLATELFYNLGANKARAYKNFKEKLLAGDESFINEIDRGFKDDKGQRQLLTDRTDPLKEWYVSD